MPLSADALVCADDRVAAAMAFVVHNLGVRRSRADVARAAHLDPAYFSKRFLRATGYTFSEWNSRIRVEYAKTILETTRLQIMEVASRVGYEDLTTFERNFRRYEGRSPREHRQSAARHKMPKRGHSTPSKS
jgi:transcriptional regulator GlxA family with amidase domain